MTLISLEHFMSPLDLKRKKDLTKFTAGTLGAVVVYFGVSVPVRRYVDSHSADPHLRWIMALPLIAFFLAMLIVMRNWRRMDELDRKIHSEALAFAFISSFLLISVCEFLMQANLLTMSVNWLTLAMIISWEIGLVLAIKRYN